MKAKEFKTFIFFFGIIAFIVLGVNIIREITFNNGFKKDIKDEFRSLVIDTYNPREWIEVMSHVRIKNQKGEIVGLPMHSEIRDYIEIGDSLIKIKDENFVYVVKPSGERKSFYYRRISMKRRSHWTFPKEWKNKWMESSAWDTLQKK